MINTISGKLNAATDFIFQHFSCLWTVEISCSVNPLTKFSDPRMIGMRWPMITVLFIIFRYEIGHSQIAFRIMYHRFVT